MMRPSPNHETLRLPSDDEPQLLKLKNWAVAYPELVSRGVSKSRKFKWLVKVGACKDVNPLILKKKS